MLAFDLAIHTARPGHSRAIDRYAARATQLQPGSDELVALAAMRLCTLDVFAMTSGIIVPVDRAVMVEVLDEVLPRARGTPEQVANDRRFATAIDRVAVAQGLMERIDFEETPPSDG